MSEPDPPPKDDHIVQTLKPRLIDLGELATQLTWCRCPWCGHAVSGRSPASVRAQMADHEQYHAAVRAAEAQGKPS